MITHHFVQAGMTSINDFAATYMSQSLPFGGVKESGFGRFGGIEGLRALCIPKAVTQDRYDSLKLVEFMVWLTSLAEVLLSSAPAQCARQNWGVSRANGVHGA